jgi:hypothetical protein
MNPSCNRLSLRQATRQTTQLCDQALALLDLRATQLSMPREIGSARSRSILSLLNTRGSTTS